MRVVEVGKNIGSYIICDPKKLLNETGLDELTDTDAILDSIHGTSEESESVLWTALRMLGAPVVVTGEAA